jgi:hypothetical protein
MHDGEEFRCYAVVAVADEAAGYRNMVTNEVT